MSYALPNDGVLCTGVKKASTFMETILVVVLTLILTGLVIEAAFRVYESFTGLNKEHHLFDPDASHPSGNTNSLLEPPP